MSDKNTLEVKILEKDYLIACPEEEQASLSVAATLLDTKMREIRGSGKVHGTERIAVMAALNMAYEMMASSDTQSKQTKLMSLIEQKIDKALKASH